MELRFYVVFAVMWFLCTQFQSVSSFLPMYACPFFLGVATAVFLPQLKRFLVGQLPSALGHLALAAVLLNLPDLRTRLNLTWDRGDLFADTWLHQTTAIPGIATSLFGTSPMALIGGVWVLPPREFSSLRDATVRWDEAGSAHMARCSRSRSRWSPRRDATIGADVRICAANRFSKATATTTCRVWVYSTRAQRPGS